MRHTLGAVVAFPLLLLAGLVVVGGGIFTTAPVATNVTACTFSVPDANRIAVAMEQLPATTRSGSDPGHDPRPRIGRRLHRATPLTRRRLQPRQRQPHRRLPIPPRHLGPLRRLRRGLPSTRRRARPTRQARRRNVPRTV